MKNKKVVLTTGILRKNSSTKFAIVDTVNLSPNKIQTITVQVFDWSNGLPKRLPVTPCGTKICTTTLKPNTSKFIFADVSKVGFKYEVRITVSLDKNFVTNVFGLNNALSPQEGNTVLQHELRKLKR